MRAFVRYVVTALSVACVAGLSGLPLAGSALAQSQTSPGQAAPSTLPVLRQLPLSDKQIEAVIAALKDMNPITDKLPVNAPADPKIIAQLEAIAKKHGFASYDEYNVVIDNISLVLGGIDPASRKYVGSEAVIKGEIAQVEADNKMSADDKKQALNDLNLALKMPAPVVQNKGNIDLVIKYYDKLDAVMGEDQN